MSLEQLRDYRAQKRIFLLRLSRNKNAFHTVTDAKTLGEKLRRWKSAYLCHMNHNCTFPKHLFLAMNNKAICKEILLCLWLYP